MQVITSKYAISEPENFIECLKEVRKLSDDEANKFLEDCKEGNIKDAFYGTKEEVLAFLNHELNEIQNKISRKKSTSKKMPHLKACEEDLINRIKLFDEKGIF